MKIQKLKITILTDPVPYGLVSMIEIIKKGMRYLKYKIQPPPIYSQSIYRGHFAVTRSLVEGINKLEVLYNYNPQKKEDVGDIIVVLSGVSALKQAIQFKKKGVIKVLLAGPNLVNFPSDHNNIICSKEVDICIAPSRLTCSFFIGECPILNGRCESWAAGVDTNYWMPSIKSKKKQVVIYNKQCQGFIDNINKYVDWLFQKGYSVSIIEYGNYTREEYKFVLDSACLLIGFTSAESQGIAWAEAWSVNVPTLLWYKGEHYFIHPKYGKKMYKTSTAPYLTSNTGEFFTNFDEFKVVFSNWEMGRYSFRPRDWVIKNMSDEISAKNLLNIISNTLSLLK